MSNFLNCLVLFPTIPLKENIELIAIELLQKKGLISQQWTYNNEDFYLAGHKFSSLLIIHVPDVITQYTLPIIMTQTQWVMKTVSHALIALKNIFIKK